MTNQINDISNYRISREILKTPMNTDGIQTSLEIWEYIEKKIKEGKVFGNKDLYDLNQLKLRYIEILKGSNGNFSREAPISPIDLGIIFFKQVNCLKNLDCYTQCIYTDNKSLLCINNYLPSLWVTDNHKSVHIYRIDTDYKFLVNIYFGEYKKRFTKQPDNLIKITLEDNILDNFLIPEIT